MRIDPNRLRVLLAEHSVKPDRWWLLRDGETGSLLNDVRQLIGNADPGIRRQIWEVLDRVVDDGNRDNFFALLVGGLDIEQLRRLLTDTDPRVRSRARWLDTRGLREEAFVTMMLDLLADNRFDHAWPDCIRVLRRQMNFDALVDALAQAPKDGVGERLWVTLGLPGETRVPDFLPEHSPAALVSCQFSWDCLSEDSDLVATHECRHLPIVLALLGSALENVREQAVSALCVYGTGVVAALRSVSGLDRLARHGAMTMLAQFGWNHLPPGHLAVLQRLIGMKQRVETPEPLDFERLAGSWYALPTTDQAAVLDAFDLRDPVPATMRIGFAPWQGIRPMTMYPDYWKALGINGFWDLYPEVFVTPALDGWTLVFCKDDTLVAKPEASADEKHFEMYRRIQELSVQFGTAHWYEQFPDDYASGCWSQWCIAQDGAIRMHCVSSGEVRIRRSDEVDPTAPPDRLYAWLEANDNRREPSPSRAEPDHVEAYLTMLREHFDEHYLPSGDDGVDLDSASPLQDKVFGTRAAARRLSVNLETLGPHTRVHGAGALAIPAHLRHRPRRGALPI